MISSVTPPQPIITPATATIVGPGAIPKAGSTFVGPGGIEYRGPNPPVVDPDAGRPFIHPRPPHIPPARDLANTYGDEFAALGAKVTIAGANELELFFESLGTLQLAQGVLRDTVDGVKLILSTHDIQPPIAPTEPSTEAYASFAAQLPGLFDYRVSTGIMGPEVTLSAVDPGVPRHLRPLLQDTFNGAKVLFDFPLPGLPTGGLA